MRLIIILGIVIFTISSANAVRHKRGLVPGTGWQSYNTPQPTSRPGWQQSTQSNYYPSYTDKYQSYYNTPAPYHYPARPTTAAPRWSNGGSGWGYGSSSSGNYGSSYNSPGRSSYGSNPSGSYSSGRGYDDSYGSSDYSSSYNYYDDFKPREQPQYSLIGRDGRTSGNSNTKDVQYSLIGRDGRKQETTTQQPQYSLIGRDGRPVTAQRPNKPLKSICQQNEIEKYQRYAFFKNDSRCYELGTKGPCKSNMRFYLEETGSEYGECDCDANVGYTCGRPLIYYAKKDWCFPAYSRGPCESNYWLTLDIKGQATCDYNSCTEQQRRGGRKDSDCEHWVSVKGRCYETSTQGFCLYTEELVWNIYDSRATGPQCSALKDPNQSGGGSGWSSSTDTLRQQRPQINKLLPCLPGQKATQRQRCTPNKITPQTRTW